LTTLYLASAKNTNSWHDKKEDLQHAFPLDVSMVPSLVLVVAADGERLSCDVYSLGETICFRSLEFIVICFGSLSLSPKGSDSGSIFMGMARSGLPSLCTILEDSTD
jgi:hypothetical protein